MIDDFKMIVCKLPITLTSINLYCISDVHIGSREFNKVAWEKFLDVLQNDPVGYVVMAGDLINNGLKTSKSNSYEDTMRPAQQKETLYQYLNPIKDKILAVCGGNHCYRSVDVADDDPLYDVMCRLQLENIYRQNICFLKICLGQRQDKQRQITYVGVISHGSSRLKNEKFNLSIDGADFCISGHTHQQDFANKGKIRIDPKNNTVAIVGYKQIVNTSFLQYGGYGVRGQYLPTAPIEYPKLILSGSQKQMIYSETFLK